MALFVFAAVLTLAIVAVFVARSRAERVQRRRRLSRRAGRAEQDRLWREAIEPAPTAPPRP